MDLVSDPVNTDPDDGLCAYTKKRKSSTRIIRMYKCMVCNEKFLNKDALEEHKLIHTTIKPFECTYCGYKSSLKDILRNHIKIQHGVIVNRNDIISLKKYEMIVEEYKCKICTQQFDTKKTLHIHYQSNEPCKPYACSHCEINFEKELEEAKKEDMGDLDTKEEPISDEDFESLELQSPLLLVADTRKMTIYKCAVCNKQFHSKSSLYRHNMSHYGLKSFGCTQCEYRCALRGIMKNHMEIRHGISVRITDIHPDKKDKMFIRAYKCTTCNKIMPSKERLQMHLALNNKCKPFKCIFCDYRSSMKNTMKRHIQGQHGHNSGTIDLFQDRKDGVEIMEVSPDDICIEDDSDIKVEIESNEIVSEVEEKYNVESDENGIVKMENYEDSTDFNFTDNCIKQEVSGYDEIGPIEIQYEVETFNSNDICIKLEYDDFADLT